MATRNLSVKFTSEGFTDLRQQLASVGKSFDEVFQTATQRSQQAIAASKAAAGDTKALAQAQKEFENAAKQANTAIAGSFRELGIKTTASIEAQKAAAISAYEAIKKSGTASAQDLANAQAALEKKLKSLDAQLDQTGKKTEDLGQSANKAAEGYTVFKNILANLGTQVINNLVNSMRGLVGSVIQVGAQAEKTAVAFETFLGSAEKAKQVMEQVRNFAATTPFELPEVTEAAKQLLATKTPADQLIPTIKMLGEIAAGADKPLSQLLFVYTQIKNQGRALGQDINQLLNAGLSMEDIAKALGKSAKEMGEAKASSQGLQLSFEEVDKVLKSVTSEGGRFYGLMDKLGSTTAVKLSNLNDAFTKIYQSIYDGISPAIAGVLDLIVKTLDPLGENKEIWKDVNAQALEFKGYLDANPGLAKELNKALTEGVKVALSAVSDLAKGILGYLQKNPTAIADAVKQMGFLITAMGEFVKLINLSITGWAKIANLIGQIKNAMNLRGTYRDEAVAALGSGGGAAFDRLFEKKAKAELESRPVWNRGLSSADEDRIAEQVLSELLQNPVKAGLPSKGMIDRASQTPPTGSGPAPIQYVFPTKTGKAATTGGGAFGAPRRRSWGMGTHQGTDIQGGGYQGDSVYAVVGGTVQKIRSMGGGSYAIEVMGYDRRLHKYLHVRPVKGLKVGDEIGTDQQIATIAPEDNATRANGGGAHLHYELWQNGKAINPANFLNQLPRPTGEAKLRRGPFYQEPKPQQAQSLTEEDRKLLAQLALAEAEGEGVAGQAAVIRSVLNRKALIDSGAAKASDYAAKSSSIRDLVYAKRGEVYQYSPVGDGRINKKFLPSQYAQADKALGYAMDDRSLELLGLSPTAIASPNFQAASLGRGSFWRGESARVGNHLFGGDRFSLSQNMVKLFDRVFVAGEDTKSQAGAEKEADKVKREAEKVQAGAEKEADKVRKEIDKKRKEAEQEAKKVQERAFKTRMSEAQQVKQIAIETLRKEAEIAEKRNALLVSQGKMTKEQQEAESRRLKLQIQLKENDLSLDILRFQQSEKLQKIKAGQEPDPRNYAKDIQATLKYRQILLESAKLDEAIAASQRDVIPLGGDVGLANFTLKPFGSGQISAPSLFSQLQFQTGVNGTSFLTEKPLFDLDKQLLEQAGNAMLEAMKPTTSFISDTGIFNEAREGFIKTLTGIFNNPELATAIARSFGATEILQVDYGQRLSPFTGGEIPSLEGMMGLDKPGQRGEIAASLDFLSRQQTLNQLQQNEEAVKLNETKRIQLELEQRILEIQILQQQGKLTEEEAQQRINLEKAIAQEQMAAINRTGTLAEEVGKMGQNAFAKFFQDTITGTQSVAGAFQNMANSVLSSIAQMAAQMATVQFFGMFGLPTKGMAFDGFGLFASGGYTGDGGLWEPKGVVHGGEFVLNKFATQAIGTEVLSKINKTGRLPSLFVPQSSPPPAPSKTVIINQNFTDQRDRYLTQNRTLLQDAVSRAMK